jgi:hypothetical protein
LSGVNCWAIELWTGDGISAVFSPTILSVTLRRTGDAIAAVFIPTIGRYEVGVVEKLLMLF